METLPRSAKKVPTARNRPNLAPGGQVGTSAGCKTRKSSAFSASAPSFYFSCNPRARMGKRLASHM